MDLTEKGKDEAARAGRLLREQGITFTSVLKKAIRTLWIVLDALDAI